ncbi:hypothetical protein TCDM_10729 [Trypanosoma cruzi Dm28c]|uniref:Uncharacterized protein n=1 Tax=Trypanosoma cruzi Dm28c TaxID=1416333 RepID=V5D2H7_TRYCR|nr:hypothetical protein TCDM_10729 [Trypanosoma cruzi Dm28c]
MLLERRVKTRNRKRRKKKRSSKKKKVTRRRKKRRKRRKTLLPAPQMGYQQAMKSSRDCLMARREHRIKQIPTAPKQLETVIQQLMVQGHEKKKK